MTDFRQMHPSKYQRNGEDDDAHQRIRQGNTPRTAILEEQQAADERTADTAQAIKGLRQVEAAGGSLPVAEFRHIGIRGRLEKD